MPALEPTSFYGDIVWLGMTPHREEQIIESSALQQMKLELSGFDQDCHGGLTRLSCSRVLALHPKGTEIRNTRQLSILCAHELKVIQNELGLERLDPAWFGASIVLEGLPDLSHLPPSSRLQSPDGCTLVVDMQNHPCRFPAITIVEKLGPQNERFIRAFKDAAKERRGLTAWVERSGTLHLGQRLHLFKPTQRPWQYQ